MAQRKKDPNKKSVRQNISMDPIQLKQLMSYCQQQDRSMSWVIRQALEKYMTAV